MNYINEEKGLIISQLNLIKFLISFFDLKMSKNLTKDNIKFINKSICFWRDFNTLLE